MASSAAADAESVSARGGRLRRAGGNGPIRSREAMAIAYSDYAFCVESSRTLGIICRASTGFARAQCAARKRKHGRADEAVG